MDIPRTIEEVLAATPASHPGDDCRGAGSWTPSPRERGPCCDSGKGGCGKEGYASPPPEALAHGSAIERTACANPQEGKTASLSNMPFVVISILSTLIVLGIMVLVHEFGHFCGGQVVSRQGGGLLHRLRQAALWLPPRRHRLSFEPAAAGRLREDAGRAGRRWHKCRSRPAVLSGTAASGHITARLPAT